MSVFEEPKYRVSKGTDLSSVTTKPAITLVYGFSSYNQDLQKDERFGYGMVTPANVAGMKSVNCVPAKRIKAH